ncbi:MAG: DUF3326 domain-containing protein, partial [Cyanobacteria bacterium REEB65]|nr:DUF3326 domain-containing protein [Cyanobacteria bacterium REEB65]
MPFVVAQILPAGIGLSLGGYAGDGTPATNVLAAAADFVVTHPNAVNAAGLNWQAANVLYVEGGMLDAWLGGALALRPVRANRVGLLVDRGVQESGGMTLVENAIGAFQAVGGGAAIVELTDARLELALEVLPSGLVAGGLANPTSLLAGARALVRRGAEAIALVGDFSKVAGEAQADRQYLAGQGADPIAGLEAILSRALWHGLGLPCAHAPYLPPSCQPCDPRAAAEELAGSYLCSVLRGLQRAPQPILPARANALDLRGPDLVVAPEGAVGGPGVLAAAARGLPMAFVHNPGVLDVGSRALGLAGHSASSYLEAAGLALALRAG